MWMWLKLQANTIASLHIRFRAIISISILSLPPSLYRLSYPLPRRTDRRPTRRASSFPWVIYTNCFSPDDERERAGSGELSVWLSVAAEEYKHDKDGGGWVACIAPPGSPLPRGPSSRNLAFAFHLMSLRKGNALSLVESILEEIQIWMHGIHAALKKRKT